MNGANCGCVWPEIPCKNDRVEKLKQSMCGGIGRRLVVLESNKIGA